MYLFMLVVPLACCTVNSQENVQTQYNSLKETLKKASKVTDSIDAMVALAQYFQDNDRDTAAYYTKQVRTLFQRHPSQSRLSKVQLLKIKQQIEYKLSSSAVRHCTCIWINWYCLQEIVQS